MSTATDLATLGWRVDTSARLAQAIKDFQRAWNLGPQLAADGNAGPATQAALDLSLSRHNAGLPDISANFSASEWACQCGGKYADCRRIWSVRAIIRGAEIFRTKVGPFAPARPNRCPGENRRVGGATRSQHLYGYALDVAVFKITVAQVRALGIFSGIGYYTYTVGGKRVQYVRHIDMRHLRGDPGTPSNPALWEYPGADKHVPANVRPELTEPGTKRPKIIPATPSPEEDDMADEETIQKIADRVWARAPWPATTAGNGVPASSAANNIGWQTAWAFETLLIARALAKGSSIDIDEDALAAAMAPALASAVTEALTEADIPNADALADAVVARFGEKLTPKQGS